MRLMAYAGRSGGCGRRCPRMRGIVVQQAFGRVTLVRLEKGDFRDCGEAVAMAGWGYPFCGGGKGLHQIARGTVSWDATVV